MNYDTLDNEDNSKNYTKKSLQKTKIWFYLSMI